MDKEAFLAELVRRVASGEIAPSEIRSHLGGTALSSEDASVRSITHHFSITKLLYALGAIIISLGIIFLVAQIWDDIGSSGRIIVTFGLGILFAAIGSYLMHADRESMLGDIFHGVGGLLVPSGALVSLYELFERITTPWPTAIIIGIVALFYVLLALYHKRAVLTFFAIANATAFLYLIVYALLDGSQIREYGMIFTYLTMAIGASYLLLARSFIGEWNKQLIGPLYFFGSAGIFIAAFSRVFEGGIWELGYFVLAALGIAYSLQAKSRSILTVSTFALVAHFIYITNEYFADSVGWPISLVVLGFIFIGLGYFSISLSKKYITT